MTAIRAMCLFPREPAAELWRPPRSSPVPHGDLDVIDAQDGGVHAASSMTNCTSKFALLTSLKEFASGGGGNCACPSAVSLAPLRPPSCRLAFTLSCSF